MSDEMERISREQLEANFRAVVRMLSEAQQTATVLAHHLREIARILVPKEVERLRETSPDMDDRAFAAWLVKRVQDAYGLVAVEEVRGALAQAEAFQARVRELEQRVRSLEGRLQEIPRLQGEIESLQREVREREQEITRLHRDLAEREARIQDLLAEIAEREGRIEALEEAMASRASLSVPEPDDEPETDAVIERDGDVSQVEVIAEPELSSSPSRDPVRLSNTAREMLRVMGERGYCLLTHIGAVLGRDRRALHRAKGQLLSLGLMTAQQAQASTGVRGRPPEILMLTDAGRAVFAELFGREAVESEYTRGLRMHKSEEHLFLIFALRDGLLARGAVEVEVFPEPQQTEYGRFEPDVVARFHEGEVVYLEAENRVKKFEQALFRKWAIRLGLGLPLDVAVHMVKMQNVIVSLATRFVLTVERPVRLRVITLERWPEDTLWTLERDLQA